MEETNISQEQNPLGTAPVGGLIGKFAIPAIISMLVSALYNIVDQIFIGQGVGMLGNAATNVAFPVTTIATALALLLGIGGNHIVRADRSPTYSMTCVLTGAIINTILDPLFIFGFGWGIKGAAWATVIGQVVSGILVIIYFGKFRKMYLEMSMLKPSSECLTIPLASL